MVHRILILLREAAYNISKPAHNSCKLWECCEEETEEGQRQTVKREAAIQKVDEKVTLREAELSWMRKQKAGTN